MPRGTKDTRERILLAAIELFYSRGYEATGMAQILKKARANSGSFYFFFKSKEDLLHAVLNWYLENLAPILIAPLYRQTDDPIQRVFLLLEGYRQKMLMTDFDFSCPIGRLALEIDPSKRQVHQKIAANFAGWTAAVQKCLEDAGNRLPSDMNHHDLAQMVLTVMEGGVMQSRAHHDIRPFDASVEQLRTYFHTLEQAASAKAPVSKIKRRTL